MHTLTNTIRWIDQFTEKTGLLLAWLCVLMALVTGAVVLLRYGFSFGSIALQESVTYMHGAVFMLGAAFTLKRGGHVRVDIFYRDMSPRARAWTDSIGGIVLLLPFCLFVLLISWPLVAAAWASLEGSPDPGGIQAVFLLKSLIPLLAISLLLQGVAEILRNVLFLLEDSH